jgi:hypothetical protein
MKRWSRSTLTGPQGDVFRVLNARDMRIMIVQGV